MCLNRSVMACGFVAVLALSAGCKHPKITAVALDDYHFGKETGIPFYLPKPLLIVAKNFRNIEDAKVGLTATAPIPNGFDDQSKYADLNARTNFVGLGDGTGQGGQANANPANTPSNATGTGTATASNPTIFSPNGAPITPSEAPSDGLAPTTFFTYHIVFVPDMTQKYGLKIRGGAGEIRAAMNLVNGWQFTGLGPYYMKDSSTAQNILAGGISTRLGGQAVADVLKSAADLAKVIPQGTNIPTDHPTFTKLTKSIEEISTHCTPVPIPNYAEIRVFEPRLSESGCMEWTEIVNLTFDRHYIGKESPQMETTCVPETASNNIKPSSVRIDKDVAMQAVAGVFGISPQSAALNVGPTRQSASVGGTTPSMNQIQVDCGDGCGKATKEFNLLKFVHPFKGKQQRGRIESRTVTGIAESSFIENPNDPTPSRGAGADAQNANVDNEPRNDEQLNTTINHPVINQPTINQPSVQWRSPGGTDLKKEPSTPPPAEQPVLPDPDNTPLPGEQPPPPTP